MSDPITAEKLLRILKAKRSTSNASVGLSVIDAMINFLETRSAQPPSDAQLLLDIRNFLMENVHGEYIHRPPVELIERIDAAIRAPAEQAQPTAERFIDWLLTEDGMNATRQARESVADTLEKLSRGAKIDWQKLYEPYGVSQTKSDVQP